MLQNSIIWISALKVLLTGSTGQLGNEIIKTCPSFINKNNVKLITQKEEFDLL